MRLLILLILLILLVFFGCSPVEGRPPGPIAPGVHRMDYQDMEIYRLTWPTEVLEKMKKQKPKHNEWFRNGSFVAFLMEN